MSKRRSKVSKIFHRSRKWVKKEVKKGQVVVKNLTIDQKGGQNGSKILPKRRSYQKWTKNGSKRRSKRVKDLRELLMFKC